jgi:hypothetical protein
VTATSLPQRAGTSRIASVAALALPLALRAAASTVSGAWLWGFDALRYLPAWAWVVWAIPGLALVFIPKTSARSGDHGDRNAAVTIPLAVLAAIGLVLAFPDRVQFVGDFLLRQGTAEEALPPAALFPQALPLDAFLHVTFPTWAHGALGIPSTMVSRILDAIEAGALVALGFAFARRTGLNGKGALACALLAGWGGWVALFTGYSKAFTEMSLLVLGCAVFGVDALRGSRMGFFYLCLTVAMGFALHRSAVGLLPALGFVTWYALRAPVKKAKPGRKAGASVVPAWLPLLVPATMLAVALPKMIETATTLDTAHFAAKGEGTLSVAKHLVTPLHLLDLFNLTFFLVPLATLLLIPAPRGERPGPWSAREWMHLVVLGAPFWLIALVLRPAQGIPRDFDVFASAGVALGVITAARFARLVRAAPATSRFSTAVVAGAVAPVLCVILLQADLGRGLVRVNALADGPPVRSESERGLWREYLGARYHRAHLYKEAVAEFAQAAALAPSPNILAAWGVAARWAGDVDSEERAFTLLLARAPADRVAVRVAALTGLARIAFERGDRAKAAGLVSQALALDPQSADAQSLAQRIDAGGH